MVLLESDKKKQVVQMKGLEPPNSPLKTEQESRNPVKSSHPMPVPLFVFSVMKVFE